MFILVYIVILVQPVMFHLEIYYIEVSCQPDVHFIQLFECIIIKVYCHTKFVTNIRNNYLTFFHITLEDYALNMFHYPVEILYAFISNCP